MSNVITRAQIRGARAMLDWSIIDLATACRLSVATIGRAENDRREPISDDLASTIRDALEAIGVLFLPDDGFGCGVRLTQKPLAKPSSHIMNTRVSQAL